MSIDSHTFNLFDALPMEEGPPTPAAQDASKPTAGAADVIDATEIAGHTIAVSDGKPRIKGWADNLRQAPNPLIRCGLFTVGNNKIARAVWGAKSPAKIDAYGSMSVGFHGEEFRQDDLDVLLELLQVVRGQPEDAPALICPAHLIRDMGWTKNKSSYARLKACIVRLQMGVISIKIYLDKERTKSLTYNGSLVKESAFREDKTTPGNNLWRIMLDSRLYVFFDVKDYTRLNWDHRKKIHAPLGKFLHAFFSSHNGQFAVAISKVMALAGYRIHPTEAQQKKALNKFRYDMLRYLEEMRKMGAIQSYKIDNEDRVLVLPMRFALPKSPKASIG